MTLAPAVRERIRLYYTTYYRDVLGIPAWTTLVTLRESEEAQERPRLERLRRLLGEGAFAGRVLNLGCGTGGFNAAAAAAGVRVVGVDTEPDALAVCRARGGRYARAAAERLPFADAAFHLVYCFSVIEHVESVEATVAEMVRVTRPGGIVYLHTPNAWSWYEGHYKLFWVPFLPAPLARLYLRARGRPTAYLATLRRLTRGRLVRALRRAGVTSIEFHADARPRESVGPLRAPAALYYRLSGISPFIELAARKP